MSQRRREQDCIEQCDHVGDRQQARQHCDLGRSQLPRERIPSEAGEAQIRDRSTITPRPSCAMIQPNAGKTALAVGYDGIRTRHPRSLAFNARMNNEACLQIGSTKLLKFFRLVSR
jgi:hypothetical protein